MKRSNVVFIFWRFISLFISTPHTPAYKSNFTRTFIKSSPISKIYMSWVFTGFSLQSRAQDADFKYLRPIFN